MYSFSDAVTGKQHTLMKNIFTWQWYMAFVVSLFFSSPFMHLYLLSVFQQQVPSFTPITIRKSNVKSTFWHLLFCISFPHAMSVDSPTSSTTKFGLSRLLSTYIFLIQTCAITAVANIIFSREDFVTSQLPVLYTTVSAKCIWDFCAFTSHISFL